MVNFTTLTLWQGLFKSKVINIINYLTIPGRRIILSRLKSENVRDRVMGMFTVEITVAIVTTKIDFKRLLLAKANIFVRLNTNV